MTDDRLTELRNARDAIDVASKSGAVLQAALCALMVLHGAGGFQLTHESRIRWFADRAYGSRTTAVRPS